MSARRIWRAANARWRSTATAATIGRTGRRSSTACCARAKCLPVAVEVFDGNTADPATLAIQITKLKQRFALKRVVLVGDRGMLTNARIREEVEPAGLDWISCLRSDAIQKLASDDGPLQLSLFDARDLAEISAPEQFPREWLIVCRNPLLAQERARKREALLTATERDLARVAACVQAKRSPLRGAPEIGRAVGAVVGKQRSPNISRSRSARRSSPFAANPTPSRAKPGSTASMSCAPAFPPRRSTPTRRSKPTRIWPGWT